MKLPEPNAAHDGREAARREYRRLAREIVLDPTNLSEDLLSRLDRARIAGAFDSASASEPRRIFPVYAARLLARPHFQPWDHDLLCNAMTSFTGVAADDLAEPSGFPRISIRAQLRAIEAGWLAVMPARPSGVLLRPGERLLWSEPVRRMHHEEVTATASREVDVSVRFPPGLSTSGKATLSHTVKLPPGEISPSGSALLALTTNNLKIPGETKGRSTIEYDDIIGLEPGGEGSRVCRINVEGDDEPIHLEGRSGALMFAVIEFAIRFHDQGGEIRGGIARLPSSVEDDEGPLWLDSEA